MTNIEQIQNFYSNESFRNLELVDSLFHDDVIFEWNSSVGLFTYNKKDVLKFSKELFENYFTSEVIVKSLFGDENNVAIKYDYYASTIENPTEMLLIVKIIALWEFEDGKIIKGYQNSVIE